MTEKPPSLYWNTCVNIKTFLHVSDKYVWLWQIYQFSCSKMPPRLSHCTAGSLFLSLFHYIKAQVWPLKTALDTVSHHYATSEPPVRLGHRRCAAGARHLCFFLGMWHDYSSLLKCICDAVFFSLFCQPFGSNVIRINLIFFFTSYSPPTKPRIVSISVYYSHIHFNPTFSEVLPSHHFSFYIAFIIYLKNFFIISHLAFFGSSSSSEEEEVQQSNQGSGECSKLMLLQYSVTW